MSLTKATGTLQCVSSPVLEQSEGIVKVGQPTTWRIPSVGEEQRAAGWLWDAGHLFRGWTVTRENDEDQDLATCHQIDSASQPQTITVLMHGISLRG